MNDILVKAAEQMPLAVMLGLFLWQALQRMDRLIERIDIRLDRMTGLLGELVGKDRRKVPGVDS